MKTRNKVLIGGGITFLVLIIGGYGLVSAFGPWGGPCGGFAPRFQAQGFHSRAFQQDMVEFILWKLDKKAKEMNLTGPQKIKYEAMRDNLESRFAKFQGERQKMKDQFQKELA
ncbi:MAG TPA: hypothetical protein VK564_01290, partial [Thermodesulfobacteriota bacterium]|nr:hypothetical protein [Thermodesulfobacteriota bacterium]